jgi:hypothetical protein
MQKHRTLVASAMVVVAVVSSLATAPAHAVPSFERETGLACSACHTIFPRLTPFGREFKENGYSIDHLPQIKGVPPENRPDKAAVPQTGESPSPKPQR